MVLPDWRELVHLSDAQLGAMDVALVHLACAVGLPGSEKIDVDFCLHQLDDWTRRVKQETERELPRFRRMQHDFRYSEAYFRALCLVTVLWRNCGVCYNETKISLDVPLDLEDSFLHGITQGQGGTCASLPVLYAAVGRRLGYPIKLVSARVKEGPVGHRFARWDGDGERHNIDVNHSGLSCHPDNYYRMGVYELPPEHERLGCFLQSMTPRSELAVFVAERACIWKELGNHRQTANAFAWALALHPDNHRFANSLKRRLQRLDAITAGHCLTAAVLARVGG